jgi:hypothetical protein
MNFNERWKQLAWDESLNFDLIAYPKSQRRDMHAMMLLDEALPGTEPLLRGSVTYLDDEVYLSIPPEQLETLSDDQIVDLIRCGVDYDHLAQRLWIKV